MPWSDNLNVSILTDAKTTLIQWENVSVEMRPCGFMKLINNFALEKWITSVLLM